MNELRAERRRSNFTHVHLVHEPISNSDASSLMDEPARVRQLRTSDFYMIGARPVAIFSNITVDEQYGGIEFTITVPTVGSDSGLILFMELISDHAPKFDNIAVKMNEGLLWFEYVLGGETVGVLAAFTPDKLLMERGRHAPWLRGLHHSRDLATYDLLYVGIATDTDSYDRLIAKGHHARVRILSDEPQRVPGARVSEEIMLFLFTVEAMGITIIGAEGIAENEDFEVSIPPNDRLVKDAEKAFVSLLQPSYNKQLYRSYPAGKDGLYHLGLSNYCYAIAEGIQLRTTFGMFKGARERGMAMSNEADFILVEGDEVTVHISGVDFPAQGP
jgi:hypothetical protein